VTWNLDDYEPVEDRLRAFWKDHPNGRILTDLVHTGADGYIVKASVWREVALPLFDFGGKADPSGGQWIVKPEAPPDATGYAQEAVTEKGVNSTSALENCETSAIGRALANLGYAAKGKRPSREEMSKSAPMRESADAGGRVDTTSSASRESSGEVGSRPEQQTGRTGAASPGSSEGTTVADGEDAADPSATLEPGEGSGHPASPSPGKGIFPVRPEDCTHKSTAGRWLPARQLNGLPVCPRCGMSAVLYRESA